MNANEPADLWQEQPDRELLAKMPQPIVICKKCLRNPARTMYFKPHPSLVAAYCEHGQAGGLIDLADAAPVWRIYTPITLDRWTDLLADTVVALAPAAVARIPKH